MKTPVEIMAQAIGDARAASPGYPPDAKDTFLAQRAWDALLENTETDHLIEVADNEEGNPRFGIVHPLAERLTDTFGEDSGCDCVAFLQSLGWTNEDVPDRPARFRARRTDQGWEIEPE